MSVGELLLTFSLLGGGFFAAVGALGFWRLPTPETRLHAPAKASTLGLAGILVASLALNWGVEGQPSFHEALVIVFLALTTPVASLFMAKVILHRRREIVVPPPPEGDWAVRNADSDTGEDVLDEIEAPRAVTGARQFRADR